MKILIVDDHALFREGLRYVLSELDDNVQVLESPTFEQATRYISDNPDLDLLLLDLNIPGEDGFVTLNLLSKKYPALPTVILSASNQRSDIQRALDAGAAGYIQKDTTSKVVLNALRLVFSGGIYVPPEMVQQDLTQKTDDVAKSASLTPRQIDVLALLARGYSNKEIATEINVTAATVKMHITSIFRSLGVSNRTQAAMVAEKLGLDGLKK